MFQILDLPLQEHALCFLPFVCAADMSVSSSFRAVGSSSVLCYISPAYGGKCLTGSGCGTSLCISM